MKVEWQPWPKGGHLLETVLLNELVFQAKGAKAKAPSQFTWVKYLQSTNAKAAPAKLFKDEGTYSKNKFKVGFKLEGIDPEHPAHFCVLSVAETKGKPVDFSY